MHAKHFYGQWEAASAVVDNSDLCTAALHNSILSRKFLTVHKSMHNIENQLFWRTEIYNNTLSEISPRGAWALLLTRWFKWSLYCSIIHSCTASTAPGLLVRGTNAHNSLITETISVLIVRCYYQQLACFLQQSMWVSSERSWWHISKWTGVKVEEWAETAVVSGSKLGKSAGRALPDHLKGGRGRCRLQE